MEQKNCITKKKEYTHLKEWERYTRIVTHSATTLDLFQKLYG